VALATAATAEQAPSWDVCSGRSVPTFEERISACTAIIESEGATPANRAEALGFRGVAYENHGDSDAAVRDYEASLQLDATSSSGHRIRGNKYTIEKNYDAAFAEYDEAIRLDPTSAFAFNNRGRLYGKEMEYDRAIADFDETIRLNASFALGYASRCGARTAAGQDLHAALSDCDESLRLQPHQTLALSRRGFIHLKLANVAEAIADFDAALSIDAKDAWSLYGRGLARSQQGDLAGSQSDIAAAEKVLPGIGMAVTRYYGSATAPDLLSPLQIEMLRH
jgi:tetratricopeptide (TPR) repeat protein